MNRQNLLNKLYVGVIVRVRLTRTANNGPPAEFYEHVLAEVVNMPDENSDRMDVTYCKLGDPVPVLTEITLYQITHVLLPVRD